MVVKNYHIWPKSATAKALIKRVNLNVNRTMKYKGKNHTCQTILLDNVQHLANFIHGKQKTFAFNTPQIDLKRADTLELRQRILAISQSDGRRLDINKSTLWYQKGLAEGLLHKNAIKKELGFEHR